MKIQKTLLITTSLVFGLGAGCTQGITNTNLNVSNSNDAVVVNTTTENTNETVTNDNTSTVILNENTNTAVEDEVDTSDWLTYINEEYGFSFRYPAVWIANEGLYGSVKLSTKVEEIGIISINRNKTIDEGLNIAADIRHTLLERLTVNGYNSARVHSVGEIVGRVETTTTWIEIDNDLIYMPDINEFPKLEQVITSFEIINE